MEVLDLFRHAESDCNLNHAHLIGGRSNHTPLSPNGILQADKLGRRLKMVGYNPDYWIASPAIRTIHTAQIVMEIVAPNAELIIEPALQEISQGDWEGLLRTDCYTDDYMQKILADSWNTKAPNGESPRDTEERMLTFLHEWAENHKDTTSAMFTHGYAVKCALAGMYNWDRRRTHRTPIENTAITTLCHEKDQWYASRINDYGHLTMM